MSGQSASTPTFDHRYDDKGGERTNWSAPISDCLCPSIAFSSAVGEAQMAEDVDRFAQEYIEAQKAAWERSDFSGLMALEDAAVVFQNINGTVFDGRDAHMRAIEGMQDSFNRASITQDWQYLLGSGDVFSLAYTWTIHSAPQPL